MSLLRTLPNILEESRAEYEQLKCRKILPDLFSPEEIIGNEPIDSQILAQGDNLDFMRYLIDIKGMGGQLQLIYVDPPFYSKANYEASIPLNSQKVKGLPSMRPLAYGDTWQDGIENYLRMLCVRLFFMKDLLAEEGCLWVHLDWHAVHYVKILLDEIFGVKNFVNEIIWHYKSGGTGKRSFSKKHDSILFYSKSKKYYFSPQKEKSYNREMKPYRFKGVKEYKDELGWHTMVNMKDVWQIDMVGRTSSERTGYATQKPEQLLMRIIESCSKQGQLCADFFGGSGTLAAAAHKMNRRWISCDKGKLALVNGLKRMVKENSAFTVYRENSILWTNDGTSLDIVLRKETGDPSQQIAEISGYRLSDFNIPLEGEGNAAVKTLLMEDPLSLITYWSLDFHYNGFLHSPQFTAVSHNGRLKTSCHFTDCGQKISMKAVDILGNINFQVIDLGEELNESYKDDME